MNQEYSPPLPSAAVTVPAASAGLEPQGLALLLQRSLDGEDLRPYAQQLINAAAASDDPYLLLELSLVLILCYQPETGLAVLQQALSQRRLYQLQRHAAARCRLLLIKTPGDLMANTPIECILQAQPIDVDVVYVDAEQLLPAALPAHDLVCVAIAEAEPHRPLLQQLAQQLADWPRPVINPPAAIPGLARPRASARLAGCPGLTMPTVMAVTRPQLQAQLSTPQPELPALPWILRPLGSHAGQGLARIETLPELAAYLQQQAQSQFYLAPFINYASADGLYRKYRIVLIDGQARPCHMGISQHWMVHYPYPEMQAEPARREEEARFLADFEHDFGRRHGAALQQLYQRLGLDYVGFDCAETATGELLIFEVANALVIHAMDSSTIFPYKGPHMQRVFADFMAMLLQRAQPH